MRTVCVFKWEYHKAAVINVTLRKPKLTNSLWFSDFFFSLWIANASLELILCVALVSRKTLTNGPWFVGCFLSNSSLLVSSWTFEAITDMLSSAALTDSEVKLGRSGRRVCNKEMCFRTTFSLDTTHFYTAHLRCALMFLWRREADGPEWCRMRTGKKHLKGL